MTRNEKILIRASQTEKQIIEDNAQSLNTNASQLLRSLGTKATEFSRVKQLLRPVALRLDKLKRLTNSSDQEVQSAIQELTKSFDEVEKALRDSGTDTS